MKNFKAFIGTLFVLFVSLGFASCSNEDDESLYSQWELVLDNHGCNYTFNDNGQCFGDGGGIGKENFEKTFVGHGWKNCGTWEIDAQGKRLSKEFYTNNFGVNPVQFYFDKDKIKTYRKSDSLNGTIVSKAYSYSFDSRYEGNQRTVILLEDGSYLQIIGWTSGAQPSCCIVHPLGVVRDGKEVYAVSIYVRMTDKELNELERTL